MSLQIKVHALFVPWTVMSFFELFTSCEPTGLETDDTVTW